MKNMKISCIDYSAHFGDEKDPESDWSLLMKHATFSHREACEFIVFLGTKNYPAADLSIYSKTLQDTAAEARKRGYEYMCVYG